MAKPYHLNRRGASNTCSSFIIHDNFIVCKIKQTRIENTCTPVMPFACTVQCKLVHCIQYTHLPYLCMHVHVILVLLFIFIANIHCTCTCTVHLHNVFKLLHV